MKMLHNVRNGRGFEGPSNLGGAKSAKSSMCALHTWLQPELPIMNFLLTSLFADQTSKYNTTRPLGVTHSHPKPR